jgi:uncharacterized protein YcbK (DUF882 family)
VGDLSTNFSRHEFACKCGCGLDTVDYQTLAVLEDVRDEFGRVAVSSGCRCESYNSAVGSSDTSQHPKCRAADFTTERGTPGEVQAWLKSRFPDDYGIGSYETFTHIDTRSSGPARWDG